MNETNEAIEANEANKANETNEANKANKTNEAIEAAFAALGLDERLVLKLKEEGIGAPTSVQAGAIPALLEGRDGILRSPTGSGKTLAYLLPLLQRIDAAKKETQAIVLAPTQELAMQIVRVAETYGGALGIRTVALIGGAALSRQLDRMKTKPQLVVGTPGRVREVASLRKLPLHQVRMAVVDETDRIFSLGGKGDVESLLRGIDRERQIVFVSATRTDAMKEAESRWLRGPVETGAAEGEAEHGLPGSIKHGFMVGEKREKVDLIRRIARNLKPSGALIFVNDIERIGELLSKLRYEGFSVDALYGDTPGKERGEVMRKFREGKTKLLIASDVAARGIDVPGLPLVIQYEPALDAEHYVHRAGRTGRMGKTGQSIMLMTPQETFIATKLGKQLGIAFEELRLREGKLLAAGKKRSGGRAAAAKEEPRAKAASQAKSATQAKSASQAKSTPGKKSAPPAKPVPEAKAAAPQAKPGGQARPMKEAKPASQAKPDLAAKPQTQTKAKAKADRKKDSKNKGAPRWLKEKRNASNPVDPS
ncbi:DEAD/DEAH box helicase [Cohnella fermenti]|uniref:RNA helicase n=1 Tax=Cohnella fermenti TaxID=2565925 RepID=A0A4S4BPT3_9BACL|nr:DEAD/DEAH box helicase [Cohnella fermenti]THF76904.1 DEAD/DEAH box helicase [Cohnella fermenti]